MTYYRKIDFPGIRVKIGIPENDTFVFKTVTVVENKVKVVCYLFWQVDFQNVSIKMTDRNFGIVLYLGPEYPVLKVSHFIRFLTWRPLGDHLATFLFCIFTSNLLGLQHQSTCNDEARGQHPLPRVQNVWNEYSRHHLQSSRPFVSFYIFIFNFFKCKTSS